MRKNNESGFSLIELLLVVLVVGVLAALAIPALQKAARSAENGGTYSTLRTLHSTQVNFYSTNSRFGRVTEINNLLGSSIGTNAGNEVNRGKFVISMTPAAPTDLELHDGYVVTATRDVPSEGQRYVYELTQTGEIRQLFP